MAKIARGEVNLEMTPMIDVVFQLIIFFIVTIKMNEQINRDIVLEDSPYGEIIESGDQTTNQRVLTIEVDKKGWVTIGNVPVNMQQLRGVVQDRYNRYKDSFSLMIRGDFRSQHKDIRRVMDVCSAIGIWRISFVAVQEHKYTAGRHQGPRGG